MDLVKDKYFIRNATSVSVVEFFWGLGFPVIVESTFLQLFLKKAGASDFLIGLVPAILIAGFSLFPLISSYLTRNCRSKKHIVLYLHVISSCSTLGYGLLLLLIKPHAALVLPAFFISYLIFSLCIGLTFPVWLDFLVKIFSEQKSIKGLSIMYIAQNIAKIIAGIFILKVVEAYDLSITSAAWIFLGSGLLFLAGSLCFIFTKEISAQAVPDFSGESFFAHIRQTIAQMLKNRNLVKFLIGDLDNYVIMTVISFYAIYATQYYGISDYTAAGLFVILINTGAILSNIMVGTLGCLNLKQKFLSTKVVGMAALSLLILSPGFTGFLLASALLGFCRGTRSVIYSPCVKKFSGREDATAYFAAAPLLTIAFGSGFPILFGKLLDNLSHLGSLSYKLMFGISMIAILITLIFGLFTDFTDKIKNTP